ncbi:MAG: DNA polymerase I, partial [Spirochaetota bacterium]
TTDGEPTGAIFGFIKMILEALKLNTPDYVVVAWDSKDKTFRNDIYPEYKANRKEAPDELKTQIPQIIEAVQSFDISSLLVENYEADDVIGTICEKLRHKDDIDIIILSGDKDLLQLVGDNVKVMANKKGVSDFKIYDREAVKEKWSVYPEKIIELFALLGDSSDNIPGIKGIGKKSAQSLMKEFDSVEEIFKNKDKIRNKRVKTSIEKDNAEESARLSKELLTIKRNLDLELNLEEFSNYDFTSEEAVKTYNKYELKSIKKSELPKKTNDEVEFKKLDEVSLDISISPANKNKTQHTMDKNLQQSLFPLTEPVTKLESLDKRKSNYKAILTKQELNAVFNKIEKAEILSFDFETTSEEPVKAQPIGFSLCWKEGEALYIPIEHNVETDFNYDDVKKLLEKIFYSDKIKIIGQNLKYEYIILHNMGITPKNFHFDTMLGAYVLNPDESPFNMDKLAERLLDYKTVKYKDLVEKNKTLLDVDFDKVVDYGCEDADITLRLYKILKPNIDKSKMKDLYYTIEMPLIPVLADMEINGVAIDTEYFSKMSDKMDKKLKELEVKIYKLNDGEEFNINSTKQLQEVLFDKLKLKSTKKTSKGSRSTDVNVLEKLANDHEIPKLILEYRTIAKLKNTYIDTLPKMIYDKTRKIHTSFNQAITATGRLSSNNPNMQNIPIKGEMGREIRRGFIPGNKNNYILSADYSQIELRLLAHFSEEPKLIDAYNNHKDLHLQTASLLFEKDEKNITADERTKGKTINFSIIYGIGARKLSTDLNISNNEAKKLIEAYFIKYPKVSEFIERQKKKIKDKPDVYTYYNRVRYLNNLRRDVAERLAVNSPIQGSSADLIKKAMIDIFKDFNDKKLKSKLIIQVHDELVFDIVENELDIVKDIVKSRMEKAADLKVPLEVKLKVGKNWDEAH